MKPKFSCVPDPPLLTLPIFPPVLRQPLTYFLTIPWFAFSRGLFIYWVGQKVHSGFSVRWCGKTRMNFLANLVYMCVCIYVCNIHTQGLSCDSAGKESACNAGDLGSIPGLGRSPGEGKAYPLQCSGLGNPMDCIVHGVTKSWTLLSNFHRYTLFFF